MPARDVLLPQPRPGGMITLQGLGQPCGNSNAGPKSSNFAGHCERHLECVVNPYIADAQGICMERGRYQRYW